MRVYVSISSHLGNAYFWAVEFLEGISENRLGFVTIFSHLFVLTIIHYKLSEV